MFVSGPRSASHPENGTDAVGEYTAKGPNAAASTRWTLEGDDASHFRVGTARGAMTELMFRSAPDYEMPRGRAMSDTNTNTYMVTLKANDGENMDTHDVDHLRHRHGRARCAGRHGNHLLRGERHGRPEYLQHDRPGNRRMVLEGDDAGALSISSTGALAFRSPPDYEMPMDADKDNTYMVTVKAHAGGEMDMRDVPSTLPTWTRTGW